MSEVVFAKTISKGIAGFDLKVRGGNASVQDFLDAVNEFIENADLPRLWPVDCDSCLGCDLCCHEPLPVTSVDVENICQALQIDFFEAFKYLWVEVQGNIVDITLKRKKGQSCVFLQDKTCRIYKSRPFICQSYICFNTPTGFNELRGQIVNQGMDDLIRKMIAEFTASRKTIPVNRGRVRYVNPRDWPRNCFSGQKRYSGILLKNVLSSDLMRVLLI